jgi:hypothetical protein
MADDANAGLWGGLMRLFRVSDDLQPDDPIWQSEKRDTCRRRLDFDA